MSERHIATLMVYEEDEPDCACSFDGKTEFLLWQATMRRIGGGYRWIAATRWAIWDVLGRDFYESQGR